MGALWGGRFEKSVGSFTQAFGASLQVDKSMYSQDIKGSLAHARMLCEKGIISKADFDKIEVGLVEIDDELAFAFCWHDFLSYSYRFAVFGSSARALTRGQLAPRGHLPLYRKQRILLDNI